MTTNTENTTRLLQELLAVIHRDGGHYVSRHGIEKATQDAMSLVVSEREYHSEHGYNDDEITTKPLLFEIGSDSWGSCVEKEKDGDYEVFDWFEGGMMEYVDSFGTIEEAVECSTAYKTERS